MAKGRHRAERKKVVWKFVFRYYQNRWYVSWRPAIRKFFNGGF